MAFLKRFLKKPRDESHFDIEDFMYSRLLPPEILEFVFNELNLSDIKSCSQTCLRWYYIIINMFKNKCKYKRLISLAVYLVRILCHCVQLR